MNYNAVERKVFVSYSRADTKEVLPLVDRLEEETGVHFWIDREGIESAAQFEEVIISAIDQAQVVLFMLSDNSQHSQWTKDEITYAKNTGKRVVPIVLHGGELQGWFLFKFGRINYIDATQDDQLQRLAADIREWLHIEGEQRQDRKKSPKPGPEPEVTEVRGSILVQCSPAGAEILIDGKSVGITPRKIGGISAGPHTVEVRASGYESRSWTVTVEGDITSEVKGSLTAIAKPPTPPSPQPDPRPSKMQSILVGVLVAVVVGVCVLLFRQCGQSSGVGDTLPPDTEVADSVTADSVESEPLSSSDLKSGIEESNSGPTVQEEVESTGSINVTCGPKGSTIKVDGKSVGTTPKEIRGLSVGRHTVEVSKSGYESRSWTVDVKANGMVTLSEDLSAEQSQSAGRVVSGTVLDSNNEPLVGALIAIKGSNSGTLTDFDGNFNLRVPDDNAILIISYVDFKTLEVSATSDLSAIVLSPLSSAKSGTINGHEWVDLGLSVKWATRNVGANSASDYGSYYAWGETSTKSSFTDDNSKTQNESTYNYNIGGKSSLDAARANWGGSWRLPTKAELQELIDECTWKWTTQGGHHGCKVTGLNGNSIFLPAAGYKDDDSTIGYMSSRDAISSSGCYWSSEPNDVGKSSCLYFNDNQVSFLVSFTQSTGCSVRPVSK